LERKSASGLLLIGLFKLLKGLLLVAAGFGALKFLHKDLAASVNHWVDMLRIDPENRFIHPILAKIFAVSPKQLKELSVGTFVYAAVLLTEGIGLLLRKHWAEYFTVISTGIFIPLEIYELAKHFTAVKVLVLLINVAIVVYLIGQLRRERRITGAPRTGRSYKTARSR
jgi:uncharacterized membrane protein (DUF2068 family)